MKEIIITKNGKEDEIKLLKDAISKKRGNATKLNDVKDFAGYCELSVVEALTETLWDKLVEQKYSKITFNKHGADIVIEKAIGDERILIEIKASNKKSDYFNKNGATSKKKPVFLWGNALKHKDIDLKSGLILADFLVFVAADVPEPGQLDYWIFSKDELSSLVPKSSIHIPSHVPTLMKDLVKKSHFDDAFIAFNKGVFSLILPEYDDAHKQWGEYPKGELHDFVNNWCPLLTEEYSVLEGVVKAKLASKSKKDFNWILEYKNNNTQNPNFKFRDCPYYQSIPANPKCLVCKKLISSLIPL